MTSSAAHVMHSHTPTPSDHSLSLHGIGDTFFSCLFHEGRGGGAEQHVRQSTAITILVHMWTVV